MCAEPVNVTDENFESEVLKADKPVLVDFFAEWCGPCKMVSPIIDELAGEYADKIKVAKIDIDSCTSTCARYGITSVPTVILFDGGEPAEVMVGFRPKDGYVEVIESRLQKKENEG